MTGNGSRLKKKMDWDESAQIKRHNGNHAILLFQKSRYQHFIALSSASSVKKLETVTYKENKSRRNKIPEFANSSLPFTMYTRKSLRNAARVLKKPQLARNALRGDLVFLTRTDRVPTYFPQYQVEAHLRGSPIWWLDKMTTTRFRGNPCIVKRRGSSSVLSTRSQSRSYLHLASSPCKFRIVVSFRNTNCLRLKCQRKFQR